jgi:hypothetical protein
MLAAGWGFFSAVCACAEDDDVRWLREPLPDREELVVANTDDYALGAQWFLRGSDGRVRELGEGLAAMHEVYRLLPSPDGALLAVVSAGEGHPVLEVVGLRALQARGAFEALHTVDPYPGGIDVVRWSDDGLVVTSDIALTYRGADGRVDPSLLLAEREEFRLVPGSWRLVAITFSATELGDRALADLEHEESWRRGEAARVLAALGEARFLPALEQQLQREGNRDVRLALREALASIRRERLPRRPAPPWRAAATCARDPRI